MAKQEQDSGRYRKDAEGRIRHVDHADEPYAVRRLSADADASTVAARYLREVLGFEDVITPSTESPTRASIQLRCVSEKQVGGMTICEFQQELRGIPVWCSGASVTLETETRRVLSAAVTYDHDLRALRVAKTKLAAHAESIDRGLLFDSLALKRNLSRAKKLQPDLDVDRLEVEITSAEPCVYRYDAERRQEPEPEKDEDRFLGSIPRLALPKTPGEIEDGQHYLATKVLFTIASPWGDLNWRVIIEPETDTALYVRPLVAHLTGGYVFDDDPLTATGDAAITPGSGAGILNLARTPRPLPGLTPSAPQALVGEFVSLQDVLDPQVAPPTVAAGNFDFDADTDDFSAVNAYYHSDAVFRMVDEMGFDMATYFDGTAFPVPVDHRGKCGQVNAKAPGNAAGDGSDGFRFGLVEAGQPVGIATDVRIVLHEFGHAILWDNVSSPNFGFAHSAGDSMAALLGDPESKAPDRFLTFPWLTQSNPGIDRRHDRDVTAGWAWGGANDDGQYGSEQILATSHFRAYRSLGGDSADLCERELAARYLVYLILHAVGTLTPATNVNAPEDWAALLALCDRTTVDFEGHAGGAVHKVIRWAFELQGAFQPPGAPTPVVAPGAPPAIDLFIDDGRKGEYAYTEHYCRTTHIWNRHRPDDGAAHEHPIPGIRNHAYAIIGNRGTEPAEAVRVRGFHRVDCRCGGTCCCGSCRDMVWPSDFKPMRTPARSVAGVAAGGYAIAGPFAWIPGESDCILVAVETPGDRSNIGAIHPSKTVCVRHFVPFDNNIAVREFCHCCGC